jgi:hypothetical protein
VVRVLGNRSRGPGSIPGTTVKKVVGLERGSLSLVSTTEELPDRKVAAPVSKTENTAVEIRHADHVAPSIRKTLPITSPTSGGSSVGIVLSRTQTMEFSLVFSVSVLQYQARVQIMQLIQISSDSLNVLIFCSKETNVEVTEVWSVSILTT